MTLPLPEAVSDAGQNGLEAKPFFASVEILGGSKYECFPSIRNALYDFITVWPRIVRDQFNSIQFNSMRYSGIEEPQFIHRQVSFQWVSDFIRGYFRLFVCPSAQHVFPRNSSEFSPCATTFIGTSFLASTFEQPPFWQLSIGQRLQQSTELTLNSQVIPSQHRCLHILPLYHA